MKLCRSECGEICLSMPAALASRFEVVLSRAHWHDGSLLPTLDPVHPDPTAWTEFRIVGVEPRLWWLTGLDGATMDVRSDCVVVRTPRVSGDLEFTPGSY